MTSSRSRTAHRRTTHSCTTHVYIATSLDGYVARKDHNLDWLNSIDAQGEDMGYEAFVDSVDVIVMGRGTFQTVLGFGIDWPYTKPVVVVSRSMTEADIPADIRDVVRLNNKAPADLMQELGADGVKRIYLDGGQLVQSFLREGLVDDVILTVAPVLLGDGIRLFGALDADVHLDLLDVQRFKCGMVQSHYKVVASTS